MRFFQFFVANFSFCLFIPTSWSLEILVENAPKNYRSRQYFTAPDQKVLRGLGAFVPSTFKFKIPDRHLVKLQFNQNIDIEASLENWRSNSQGRTGDPLTYTEKVNGCEFQFADTKGCDFYPILDEHGEWKYVALRAMLYDERSAKENGSGVLPQFYALDPDNRKSELQKLLIPRPSLANKFRGKELKMRNSPPASRAGWAFKDYKDPSLEFKGEIHCENPSDAFQCMMCNCHHETGYYFAANENNSSLEAVEISLAEKTAVAKVVMTRVGIGGYKNSVCDVVWANNGRVAHFTWTLDGKKEEVIKGDNYRKCYPAVIAGLEFRGHYASHYHSTAVNPDWSKTCENNLEIQEKKKVDPDFNAIFSQEDWAHKFYYLCDRSRKEADPNRQGVEVNQ